MSERFAWIFDKEKKKKVWVADMWSRRAILAIQTAISDAVARITVVEGAGYQTGPDVSAAIAEAIGGITELEYIVVSSLPSTGKKGVVYLVPHQHGTRDIYDEYIWVNNAFEKIGSTDVDLSGYLKDTDISAWAKASTKPTYTASEVGALPSTTAIPSKVSDLTNDSGFQTGAQVSNAISAEAGLMVPYGYCTTGASTVAKTVTVSPAVTELTTGLTIAVKFQYANTGSNPTLNVNGMGAKAIKRYGTTAAGTSAAANWNANSVVMLVYDGTYWQLADWNNTTYSGMTDAEYQAGTGTSNRLITPARLKAAILHHAPVQSVNGATGAVTVSVPTKTSDLTNDSGFITSAPVASVNGQTGAVILDATDVGALPDTTPIPTVPTNVSAFTNDAGYITGYTETDPTVPSWAKQSTKPSYTAAEVGALPNTTQIPSKTSDLTNDSGFITGYTETDPTVPSWAKQSSKPKYTASEVGALPDSTPIPTKTSDLTNDSGYITSYTETDPTVPSWAKQSSKPKYTASEVGALPDNTEIPSKTSDLTNDSGFITSSDVPPASTANPSMDGAASPGSSRNYARADHVHPSDTSKQDALSTEQLSVINNCLTINTVTGTTDANGNLKVFNGTLKHVVASWGSDLVMIPFIFGTNTYLKVMRSNSTHTAVVNERVTAYYIAV